MVVTTRGGIQTIKPPMQTEMVRVKEPEEDEVEIVEQPKDQNEKELEVTQKIIPMPDLHLLSHKYWSRKLKKENIINSYPC